MSILALEFHSHFFRTDFPLNVTFYHHILINFLKNKVFPLGAMINMFQIIYASILLLIPFCLFSGFLFTYLSRCYSEIRKENVTSAIYRFESVGSIAGGLVCSFIFIYIFSSIESSLILIVTNGLILSLMFLRKSYKRFSGISIRKF